MAKIMVCDDSMFQRKVLKDIFEAAGHNPVFATNGEELLAKLEGERVDCIFLDLLMPGISGFDVLKRLQERHNLVPVIVLSADIQESSQQKCKELGAFAFLNKPPQKEQVIQTFYSALSKKEE